MKLVIGYIFVAKSKKKKRKNWARLLITKQSYKAPALFQLPSERHTCISELISRLILNSLLPAIVAEKNRLHHVIIIIIIIIIKSHLYSAYYRKRTYTVKKFPYTYGKVPAAFLPEPFRQSSVNIRTNFMSKSSVNVRNCIKGSGKNAAGTVLDVSVY